MAGVIPALHTPGPPGQPGPVDAAAARLDDAGLVAVHGPGALNVRTGVLHGPGSTALVTGTADTAPMAVLVAAHHWVTTRQASDGVYRGTTEAPTRVTIGAAPASGSRIDVVYVKQNDQQSTITPDGNSTPVVAVQPGQPGQGKPAIPVGAQELGTVTVAAGATSTNGSGVTIANTARQTVARGARIPVRSQAERDALTRFAGLEVYRLDTGAVELCPSASGTNWLTLYDPAITGQWVTDQNSASDYIAEVATAWATMPGSGPFSVTVPSGKTLEVEWSAPLIDCPAGRGVQGRILVAGAVAGSPGYWSNSNAASIGFPGFLKATYAGTGAAVSFEVQALAVGGTGPLISGQSIGPVITKHRIV